MPAQDWNEWSLLEISEIEGKRRQTGANLLRCLADYRGTAPCFCRLLDDACEGMTSKLGRFGDQKLSIIQTFATEFAPKMAR
jgi:hypothetical protein